MQAYRKQLYFHRVGVGTVIIVNGIGQAVTFENLPGAMVVEIFTKTFTS